MGKRKRNTELVQAIAALALSLAALAVSLLARQKADYLYMVLQEDDIRFFTNEAEERFRLPEFSVSADGVKEARVLLRPGQYITVDGPESSFSFVCGEESVAHLLRRLRIRPGGEDMVILDLTREHLYITVAEAAYTYHTVEIPTGYETERYPDPLLPKDTEQVVQEGKNGCMIETYRDTYRGGALVSTEFLCRTPDDAVTEIIEYGLRVKSVEDSDRIREEHPNGGEDEGGYLLFASGDTMTYAKKLTCTATAYYGGTSTATGYPTGYGVIAVDPKVIPYGTRMWIQTTNGKRIYGMAVARDCGNFRGNAVDLWFPTYNDCRQWGRRNVTVYLLN